MFYTLMSISEQSGTCFHVRDEAIEKDIGTLDLPVSCFLDGNTIENYKHKRRCKLNYFKMM